MNLYRMGRPLPDTGRRIFCLPPAGTGASTFYPLMELENEGTIICPVSLPGREGRAQEAIPCSLPDLAHQLARELTPFLSQPYSLLGYSMGALLGYEMIRCWQEWGINLPDSLFTLACRAPHSPFSRRLSNLSSPDFRQAVSQLGGLPDIILNDDETMSLYEPLLRSDFKNCENYQLEKSTKVPSKIHAVVSAQDELLTLEDAEAWQHYSENDFSLTVLPNASHILTPAQLKETFTTLIKS